MSKDIARRWLYLFGALIVAVMVGSALYLQYVLRQDPCPLCMIQRLIFIVIGVIFFIAALHNPRKIAAAVYSSFIVLIALMGVAVASRHIWIQHLPKDQIPGCGPGLDFMLKNFPLAEVWQELLHGSGECAEKGWTLLSLGIPEWSLLSYLFLAIWAFWIAFKQAK